MIHYLKRLEPSDGETFMKQQSRLDNSWTVKELKGKRTGFYTIFHHFEQLFNETYKGDLDVFVQEEFHKLHPGLSASAAHGLLHLGFGVALR